MQITYIELTPMNNFLKLTFIKISSKQNTILFVSSMFTYLVYSIVMFQKRIPFFDEINAWNISQNCNFTELFEVSRREGHFILWYLLLKPFSLNNIGFEWSMYIINWIFAFFAVLLLWRKAPFNPWLKMFITFSLPVQMFTVYARCYAVGMLLLFAICAIYPQRKKRPILYPLLIMLLANTSIIATLAAFVFGLLYCYEALSDLRAEKITLRDLQKPFIIFSIGSIFMLSQIINYTVPWYSTNQEYLYDKFHEFFNFTSYWPRNIIIILQSFMLLTGIFFFKQDKKPYFFVLISSALLIFIGLRVYALNPWHYMFLFLFFICAMWIYLQQNKIETIWQKNYYILFFILSFLWIFFFEFPWHWNGFYKPTTKYLKENFERYRGAKVFVYPVDASIIGIVPMLKNYEIEFFSPLGTSYNSCETYINQWDPVRIDFSKIKQELLSEPQKISNSYIFVSTAEKWKRDLQDFLLYYKYNSSGVKINLYHQTDDVTIYKILIE